MNKNNGGSDRLVLIHSNFSAASAGFEEKIRNYITGKICVDNLTTRARILEAGITKVPSLVYVNSAGARTTLQGTEECSQVLENFSEEPSQIEEKPSAHMMSDSRGDSTNTTKINFGASENDNVPESVDDHSPETLTDFGSKHSSSVMEKAQQMQHSRESDS